MSEEVKMVYLTWDNIEDKVDSLAGTLRNQKFDAIVSVGRGGMIPARLLSERLNVHSIYIIDVKAYDENHKCNGVKIRDVDFDKSVHNILVVDDCLFTGVTMKHVLTKIGEYENITDITVAFLYKNTRLLDVDFNFINSGIYDGVKQWLVFPWEKK